MSETIRMLFDIFSLSFMVRAFITGVLVALCSSLLGVNLVLKRYSMIGDGLSHVGFGALAIAAAMNAAPLKVAIPVVIVTAILLLRLSENGMLKGDSAIAIVSSSALAAGVLIVSLTSSGVNLNSYMFGSIYAVGRSDMILSIVVSVIVILLYAAFYNKMFAVTFDESFAKATGTRAGIYNMITACLTAVTIVIGMRLVGSLLISSLIVFPPLTAMRVCKTYRNVVLVSAVSGVVCVVAGIIISFILDAPASACIVLTDLAVYGISCVFGGAKKYIGKKRAAGTL